MKPPKSERKALHGNTSDKDQSQLAPQLAPETENQPADPELARVVKAWPTLPRQIQAAILALAATAS
jgi:hypothetical protein